MSSSFLGRVALGGPGAREWPKIYRVVSLRQGSLNEIFVSVGDGQIFDESMLIRVGGGLERSSFSVDSSLHGLLARALRSSLLGEGLYAGLRKFEAHLPLAGDAMTIRFR